MKKFIALLCVISMFMMSLAGCSQGKEESSKAEESSKVEESSVTEESKSDYVVKVAALKGPTGMGLAKLMDDNANGTAKNQYEFTVASAADEILPRIIK